MFTYQYIRDEVKQRCKAQPATMIVPWVLDYINSHLAKLPPGSVIAEFGTFVGGTAVLFAQANPSLTIHTYDINKFDNFDNSSMLHALSTRYDLPLLNKNDIVEIQQLHLEDYTNIVMHIEDSANIAVDNLSAVLIDDNRDEHSLFELLNTIWPLLNDNGIVFADDADNPHIHNAFYKFAKIKDLELTIYSKCAKLIKTTPMSDKRQFDFKDTLLHRMTIGDHV